MTYLEGDDEEAPVGKNGPDEDVAEDTGNQVGGMGNHEGSIPVDGNKGPG
jgi:hypothetical protein